MSAGGTKFGKQSERKRRGLKKADGQYVKSGNILCRQKGNKYWPGINVGQGRDFTLFALNQGNVEFYYDEMLQRTYLNVRPSKEQPLVKGLPIKRKVNNADILYVPKIKKFQHLATTGQKGKRLKSLRRYPSLKVLRAQRRAKEHGKSEVKLY